jgi:hypothetical protein
VAIFGLLPFSFSLAQKYDCHWTFGDSAGIDFSNPDSPQSIQSYCYAQETSSESQLTISDQTGKMIAYITYKMENDLFFGSIRDVKNNVIKNGNKLLLHPYYGTFTFIPGYDSSQYYIFNTDYRKIDGQTPCDSIGCVLYRHILTVLPDGTLEVTEKNKVILEGSFSNHLAVIRHANGRDWWLMTHESTSNRFIRFIVSPSGNTKPMYQAIGRGPTKLHLQKEYFYWRGEMVFSTKGNWLCIGAGGMDLLELYRFDRCTGLLSEGINLGPSDRVRDTYYTTIDFRGIAFSPDETKMYLTKKIYSPLEETSLLQYDLTKDKDSIKNPLIILRDEGEFHFRIGWLELGPDGKVYIAIRNGMYLGVIHQPNEKHPDCQFVEQGFPLLYGKSSYGLPSFPVFRVDPLPIPGGRIDTILPDCPDEELLIGTEDRYFYKWDDGTNEDLRFVDYKPGISKYLRRKYEPSDTFCAVRCDTFYVTFRPAYLRISTSASRQICQDDSLRIGDNQQCDSCYYRWLPRTGLKNPNAKQTIAKPTQTTTYVRSTYIPNGCVVGTDTVFIRVIEKHVPPCTSVSRPEPVLEKTFILYPNPAQETVTIRYAVQNHYHLTLLDITGRELLSFGLNPSGEHTLDVSTLPEGIYILQADDRFSEKLVIVR